MSRRLFAVVAIVALSLAPGAVRNAAAQETGNTPNLDFMPALAASFAAPDVAEGVLLVPQFSIPEIKGRSPVMGSLYAATAIMQALDVHSTLAAFNNGAVEANPLMSGVANHKVAFVAAKAAVAFGTIYAARQVAKHNKVAAIITLVAINSAYAFVISHNYKVARGLK
jgi:Domain of unknown function (DUF5658)